MTMDECKQAIKALIETELTRGTRKANIEIELLHFIKGELYKED